ncbi:MAG: alpha/beta hydrolase [Chloroflexi bacterium]|nr:alpha/beta hydrolase [Chloroflexota bacterium]MBI3170408.1 alpha/beta hydrolase [Chloroflexota bacterium]
MPKINIGDRKLFYSLAGSGKPTVILETGLGDTSASWAHVQDAVAQFTSVFVYDRAGIGQSDPAPTPRTCQNMVDDLSALLKAANILPPYILVGHSFGGLIARLFASQHVNDVTGMLLVDSAHEDRTAGFEKVLSNELIARNRAFLLDPSRNSEFVDRIPSEGQVRDAWHMFDFPLMVLVRGLPDKTDSVWPSAELQRVERELQDEFLKLSPKSSLFVAEQSGHWIQKDQPELVVDGIRKVMGL